MLSVSRSTAEASVSVTALPATATLLTSRLEPVTVTAKSPATGRRSSRSVSSQVSTSSAPFTAALSSEG